MNRKQIKLNGKWYSVDQQTATTIEPIVKSAIEHNDFTAAWAMLDLGIMTGRIIEVDR